MKGQFKMELDVSAYVKLFIPQVLLTFITCGIYYPWALVKIMKVLADGLTLDGKKFKFNGEGGEVFCLYFVQMILTIITCGIYYPFAFLKIRKYFTDKLELDGKTLFFNDEQGCDFWCLLFVQYLLTYLTCGIYYPWAILKITEELLKRTRYDEQAFSIRAEGGKLFSLMLGQGLLTLITAGIYGPWAMAKIYNYMVSNIYYGNNERFQMELKGGELFSIFLIHSGILPYIALYIIAMVLIKNGALAGNLVIMLALFVLYGFMPWFAYKLYGNYASHTEVVDA